MWPAESRYCGHCRRTLNGRLCPDEHLSPKEAACCIHCGSTALSQSTATLSLRWMRWLLLPFIGAPVYFALGRSGFSFSHVLAGVLAVVVHAMAFLVVGYVMLLMVPGGIGVQLRALFGQIVQGTLRIIGRIVGSAFGLLLGKRVKNRS
jgi:hypothetical protein